MSAPGSNDIKTNQRALVFDIGGTSIRAGIVDSRAHTLGTVCRIPTPNYLTHRNLSADELLCKVFDDIFDLAVNALDGADPSMIVAGYPGPVSPAGVALRSPTILGPELDSECDVRGHLCSRWPQAPVTVLNDLSCAGYGFVARGHKDFCVITVGSGIGNKVFLQGRPITGPNGRGGEIGHLHTLPDSGATLTAARDELGNIASGRGTIHLWRETLSGATTAMHNDGPASRFYASDTVDMGTPLAEAFHANDELAVQIVRTACHPLAATIAVIHLAIGLESFFIVGGFAKALGEKYLDLLIEIATELTWDLGQDWNHMISLGAVGEEEALLGAAYLAGQKAISNTEFDARMMELR